MSVKLECQRFNSKLNTAESDLHFLSHAGDDLVVIL
jgi:hypothetical protein